MLSLETQIPILSSSLSAAIRCLLSCDHTELVLASASSVEITCLSTCIIMIMGLEYIL